MAEQKPAREIYYFKVWQSTKIHPTRISEFHPISVESKPATLLLSALSEQGFHFEQGKAAKGYAFMQGRDMRMKLDTFYEDNRMARREKPKMLIIVGHGISGTVRYNPTTIDKATLEKLEKTVRDYYLT